jgi:hypothetical protein
MNLLDNILDKTIGSYISKELALRKPPITERKDAGKNFDIDFFTTFESLYRKEIKDWKRAREERYNRFNPRTYSMQQLYKDSMIDLHLTGAIDNRIRRVTNRNFYLKDARGAVDSKRSVQIQTKWFKFMVRKAIESKFYGYSILYINEFARGKIKGIREIGREHVIPERNMLLKNPLDTNTGLYYTDYPNFLIYMSLGENAVGMLEKIAPLTILKRHSWASWDEFEQVFGCPLRIAKTMVNTPKNLNETELWMRTMGRSGYGIFPSTTQIEVIPNGQTDSFNVFNEKRRAVNEEISKAVNGQTMTMDTGGSLAQSKTHLKTEEQITADDIADVQYWFDDDFAPVLRNFGYDIPEGYYLSITANDIPDIDTIIKRDDMLMRNGANLTPEYIEETYSVKLDKEQPFKVQNGPTEKIGDDKEKGAERELSFFV